MKTKQWLKTYWPGGVIGLYFLLWTNRGLKMYFGADDMMNCYKAWSVPLRLLFEEAVTFWRTESRPVGGLWYRGMYALADFHPLPYRLACFVLLLINLVFQYRVFSEIGGSRGIAWAALLFGCFQGTMWEIYTSSASIYDILCGTFYFAAMALYVTSRGTQSLNALRAAVMVLLAVLAIGCKEMALPLPITILLYETLFHPPKSWKQVGAWAVANSARIAPIFLVSFVCATGRLLRPGARQMVPAYVPHFALGRLLETTTAYTRLLLDVAHLSTAGALLFWAGCLATALLARSRLMLFGLLTFDFGMLPMWFVPPRMGGYPFYVPMFGLALYVAGAFSQVRGLVCRPASSCGSRLGQAWVDVALAGVFVLAVAGLHYKQTAKLIRNQVGPGWQDAIRVTASRLPGICPKLPAGSRVLLIDSPFGEETWTPMFTLALLYHEPRLTVINGQARETIGQVAGRFDYIFAYTDNDYVEVKLGPNESALDALKPASFVTMSSPLVFRNIVKDIGGLEAGTWRWARQDPELRFTAPAHARSLFIDLSIPDSVIQQTGPVRISIWVNDAPLGTREFPQPGSFDIRMHLPTSPPEGSLVNVHIHVHNPYIAEKDKVRLGFILTSAGLQP